MAGVDVEHYTVKDQRCGQEEYRNVKLVLKPDFTAQQVDCTTGSAGGFSTTKLGTYTVNQEKGVVVVKFTKSQYDHSDTSRTSTTVRSTLLKLWASSDMQLASRTWPKKKAPGVVSQFHEPIKG